MRAGAAGTEEPRQLQVEQRRLTDYDQLFGLAERVDPAAPPLVLRPGPGAEPGTKAGAMGGVV